MHGLTPGKPFAELLIGGRRRYALELLAQVLGQRGTSLGGARLELAVNRVRDVANLNESAHTLRMIPVLMQRDSPAPRSAEWFRRDAERNERARLERLRIDGRKSVGRNIEEGAALIALGFEVQRAFDHTRR